jgi:hypothetical protein
MNYPTESDQPHIRDGIVGRAKRTRGHQCGAVACEGGDGMDARGLEGSRQRRHPQNLDEPVRQPRWACSEDRLFRCETANLPGNEIVPRMSLMLIIIRV